MQVAHQGPATLGIALVALSEELGISMAHRALEHLLQYGEPSVRCRFTPPTRPSSVPIVSAHFVGLFSPTYVSGGLQILEGI